MAAADDDADVAFVRPLPGHKTVLLNNLHQQWLDSSLCDLQLVVEGRHMYAHSCVISAFCPTLADMLQQGKKSKSQGSAELPDKSGRPKRESFSSKWGKVDQSVSLDFSFEVMECVLSTLYTGVLKPKVQLIEELLKAAEWLQAQALLSAIKDQLTENEESPLWKSIFRENTDVARLATKLDKSSLSTEVTIGNVEGTESIDSQNVKVVDGQKPISETESYSAGVHSDPDKEFCLDSLIDINKDAIKATAFENNMPLPRDERNSSPELLDQAEVGVQKEPKGRRKRGRPSTRVRGSGGASKGAKEVSTSKLMVARMRKELIELRQKRLGSQVAKPSKRQKKTQASSEAKSSRNSGSCSEEKSSDKAGPGQVGAASTEMPPSTAKSKRGRKKKGLVGGLNSAVIEELSSNEPVKLELDFLMGNINHLKCHRCSDKFFSVEAYHEHINNHPVFPCPECGVEFVRKFNLTKHIRYFHEGAPHLVCKLCGTANKDGCEADSTPFRAKTETEMRRHSWEVHQIKDPFTCPHEGCEFRSWKYDRVVRHQAIHEETRQFICDKCGQDFAQQAGLISHRRACYQLQQYLCDLCGQSFNHAQSMRLHRRNVHYGERKYKCSVCSNSFSDHSNLRRHMRIHDNSFPYKCPACPQKYRHSNSLKAHMAAKHSDLPPEKLIIPSPQPRNRLGGRSFKRYVRNFAEELNSEGGSARTDNPSLTDVGGSGNVLSAYRRKRTRPRNETEMEGEGTSGDMQQGQAGPDQQHHVYRVGDLLMPAQDQNQSNFEVPPGGLEITIEQQAGVNQLRLPEMKATGDTGLSEPGMLSNKGLHLEQVDTMKEYAAFLEKQTSLISGFPGMFIATPYPNGTATTNSAESYNPQFSQQLTAAQQSMWPMPVASPFALTSPPTDLAGTIASSGHHHSTGSLGSTSQLQISATNASSHPDPRLGQHQLSPSTMYSPQQSSQAGLYHAHTAHPKPAGSGYKDQHREAGRHNSSFTMSKSGGRSPPGKFTRSQGQGPSPGDLVMEDAGLFLIPDHLRQEVTLPSSSSGVSSFTNFNVANSRQGWESSAFRLNSS